MPALAAIIESDDDSDTDSDDETDLESLSDLFSDDKEETFGPRTSHPPPETPHVSTRPLADGMHQKSAHNCRSPGLQQQT
jgi:hypothetical protein